jgi:acyl-CoA synthetase (AMP-forming)/AMP-acid ligase II
MRQTTREPATYHLADLFEAVVPHVADRTALVCGDERRTYAELEERANRLAHWMQGQGIGKDDFVGMYLRNSAAHVEALIACYKLRAVPINVNFRYVDDELRYLFNDADLAGVIHDADFGDRVKAVLPDTPTVKWTLSLADYEAAIADQSPERDFGPRSNDDLYVLYTGGTTGMPKGVVWRIEDAFFACIGGGDPTRLNGEVTAPADVLDRIVPGFTFFSTAPLMHAAGGWTTWMWLLAGGKVVLLPGSFVPEDVWRVVEEEKANTLTFVGDAMARPLLDAWDASGGRYDVSSLFGFGSGGAPLTTAMKEKLAERFPNIVINDGYGSSETGIQGSGRYDRDKGTTTFSNANTIVIDEETFEPIEPGSGRIGKTARTGRMPLRYHNDPEKTARTFVEVGGTRYAISGDMATVEADGTITLLGRGSQCINTGGEKVFPEEVEAALRAHDGVYDVLVVGAPDERWGQRVVAVVQPVDGVSLTADDLREHCRAKVAGYKVPKDVVFVDRVVRSPSGKADYRWAADVALSA